jgi:hypothetical protein
MKAVRTAVIIVGAAALAAATAGVGLGLAAGASASFSFAATASTLGISTTLLAGGALTGAAVLAQALTPSPSAGGSQTKWKADPYAGIPYVMGRTLVAGDIRAKRGSGGSNPYEHFVTVLSLGPVRAIETSFANKTTLNFPGGVTGTPAGFYYQRIWQTVQLGLTPEPAALQPLAGVFPDWTPAHKLSGYAATLVTMLYDAKGKNTLTTEPAMSWIIEGVLVYDPRLDSTYPGGNGPCRALDETTYVYSEDPHLHGLTWALGRHQNGRRIAGIGAPISQIDVASFVEGANLNEVRRWKIGGQITTRPDTPWNSLKSILQAGGATPVFSGGIISCINRAPRVSLATITRDDIVGDCSFSGTQPRRTRINGMVPSYRSEAHDWQMVPTKGVLVADWVAQDGGERVKEQSFALVQDVDQVTQLATYEVADAREAGPGSIPLKPWWLNFRLGDCVTFSPEEGWSVKIMIMGRDLDAQTGTVTYTIRSETDAKHAYALGQTGVAPSTANIVYDTSVAAPAETDWQLTGATLTANGGSIPALIVDGAVGNPSADAVLFEQRPFIAGQAADAGWSAASLEPADVARKEFGVVTPGTRYEVGVRYRVRGMTGDRRILGPVTAGQLVTAGALQQAISTSFPIGLTITAGADGHVVISDHVRRYTDGHPDVAVTGATIATGLAAGDFRAIGYDDPNRVGGAVAFVLVADGYDALASPTNSGRHYVGTVTIPTVGSPPSSGGGATPPGGYCVTTDTPLLVAPGVTKAAGAIVIGVDRMWTRHEDQIEANEGGWGSFAVEALEIVDSNDVWHATIDGRVLRATGDHLVYLGAWMKVRDVKDARKVDGTYQVVKLTVTGAHTYVSNGILSHNIKATQPDE